MDKKEILIFFVLPIVFGGGLLWYFGFNGKDLLDSESVRNVCKRRILEKLKTPSTAKFSNFKKIGETIGIYDVDAQNGFGAYLRETYLCTNESFWEMQPVFPVKHIKELEDLSEHDIAFCMQKAILSEEEKVLDKCIAQAKLLEQYRLTKNKKCQDSKILFEKGEIDQETLDLFCNK